MARKDPHAVALGKKGGNADTPAQAEARARNLAHNRGPAFKYRLVGEELQKRDGDRWIVVDPPLDRAARAFLRRHNARNG
jgi:hypothetical protein